MSATRSKSAKPTSAGYAEKLALYEKLVATNPEVTPKGDTMCLGHIGLRYRQESGALPDRMWHRHSCLCQRGERVSPICRPRRRPVLLANSHQKRHPHSSCGGRLRGRKSIVTTSPAQGELSSLPWSSV
jgi:hypothetical protein